jgi:uncharacterized protein
MKVKCPRCKVETEYNEANSFRPFCSERCQLIDLGAWAEGSYTIPVTDPSAIAELLEQNPEIDIQVNISTDSDSDENLH